MTRSPIEPKTKRRNTRENTYTSMATKQHNEQMQHDIFDFDDEDFDLGRVKFGSGLVGIA